MRRVLVVLALLGFYVMGSAVPAHASVTHAQVWGGSTAGNKALNWAERNAAGHWYLWGGTGPSYDCSGLVMEALGHGAGIWLPHSTYSMLANGHLHRVYSPQRGDLAFFGSGHVEIVTAWWHTTFGAHHSGTTIGWRTWSPYYYPTAFYRVW